MYLIDPATLDRLRRARGLTRTQLAAMSIKTDGTSPSRQLVSYYLDGHRRTAPPRLAESISRAVGIETTALWAPHRPKP